MFIRERLQIAKTYIDEHRNETIIIGVMAGISFGIALLATGDLTDSVEAVTRRRRWLH